eukprot:gene10220-7163_t
MIERYVDLLPSLLQCCTGVPIAPSIKRGLTRELKQERYTMADAHTLKEEETSAMDPTTMANSKARLMRDFQQLRRPSAEELGISVRLHKNCLFLWKVVISGPDGTAWEGGLYQMEFKFMDTYPMTPPHVKFVTPVFHPNVYPDGSLCLDIISSMWTPTLDVQTLLLSIQSLLNDPNPSSAANSEAAETITRNPNAYYERVKRLAEASLEMNFSCSDEEDEETTTTTKNNTIIYIYIYIIESIVLLERSPQLMTLLCVLPFFLFTGR